MIVLKKDCMVLRSVFFAAKEGRKANVKVGLCNGKQIYVVVV